MNRLITKYVVLVPLLVVVSGCSKNDVTVAGGYEMTFAAELSGISTKALYENTDLTSLKEFNVTGFDVNKSSKVIDNRRVSLTGGRWKMDDNPIMWPDGHTMTFWGEANMPAWAETGSATSTSTTFTVSSIPAAAADQSDPLIGYYSGTGNNGQAKLMFYHPLTAISFTTGDLGDPVAIASINSVKLIGVHKSGNATVAEGSSGLSYAWSTSGTLTVTGPFTSGHSSNPFILIPQNVASSPVTVEISVTPVSGATKTVSTSLPSDNLAAGYHYTYTLDYIPNVPMEETLKVTLSDWVYITSASGKKYFDANFDD